MDGSLKKIIVIGGGISGLSAAFYTRKLLAEKGINAEITVIEKEEHWGGKIQTLRKEGFIIERGPDSFLARKMPIIHLTRELGLEDQLVATHPKAKKTYILHNGRLHPMPPGLVLGIPTQLAPFMKTGLISPLGKARAALDLVLPKRNNDSDEALGHFLERRLGKEVLEYIAEPLLAGIYAGDTHALSLKATFPQFHAVEQKHRSLIRGILATRKEAAETSGLPAIAKNSMFLSYKNGLSTLVEGLLDALNTVQLINGVGVDSLARTGGGCEDHGTDGRRMDVDGREEQLTDGRKLEDVGYETHLANDRKPGGYAVQLGDGRKLDADGIVVALPTYAAALLLSPFAAVSELSRMPYVSVANIVMAFDKEALAYNFDGSGFLVPRKEGRHITACTWTSSKWSHTAPEGKVLLRCYVGRSGEEDHVHLSDQELVRKVQQDLREILGITAAPLFYEATRWYHSMPQYPVGHLENMQRVRDDLASSMPGVVLTGAGYHGVGIPDCVRQGKEAAEQVLAYFSKLEGH